MLNFKFISTDSWLTPPWLIEAAGPFDFDPACPPNMPWRTAIRMVALPENGLDVSWSGFVWLNPPYSDIRPWVEKLAAHGNGLLLVPAKATDTRWAQFTLQTADAILFIAGRLLFHYPNGIKSKGKWSSSMLCAYGNRGVETLKRLCDKQLPGVLMVKL